MTPEEKKKLHDRLQKANAFSHRISYLETALEKLEKIDSEDACWLKFNIKGSEFEMFYSNAEGDSFSRVCWFDEEDGLTDKILEFLKLELVARKNQATSDYDAA